MKAGSINKEPPSDPPRRSWIRAITTAAETTEKPASMVQPQTTVWKRNIADYAGDVANAQRMVEQKRAELANADEQLTQAQAAFIQHCRDVDLPFEIEASQWPRKDWRIEE